MVVATTTTDLVCVDLSNFDTRKAEITKQLMHAGTEVGFFYVSCRHTVDNFGSCPRPVDEATLVSGADLQSRHSSGRHRCGFRLEYEVKGQAMQNPKFCLTWSYRSSFCRLFELSQEYKETLATDTANKSYTLGYSAEKMKSEVKSLMLMDSLTDPERLALQELLLSSSGQLFKSTPTP